MDSLGVNYDLRLSPSIKFLIREKNCIARSRFAFLKSVKRENKMWVIRADFQIR